LAEIVNLQSFSDEVPQEVFWRDRDVPVLYLGDESAADAKDGRGAKLVAIFLGLVGEECEYWGVAVRADGLGAVTLAANEVIDSPDAVAEHATAAFNYAGKLYQVPDLDRLQKQLAASRLVA